MQVKQLMVSRLSDPELGVRKIAEWIKCSPDYLSSLFHKWTGNTLIDTINPISVPGAISSAELQQKY